MLYEGAFGKRDLVKGNDMTLELGVLDRVGLGPATQLRNARHSGGGVRSRVLSDF